MTTRDRSHASAARADRSARARAPGRSPRRSRCRSRSRREPCSSGPSRRSTPRSSAGTPRAGSAGGDPPRSFRPVRRRSRRARDRGPSRRRACASASASSPLAEPPPKSVVKIVRGLFSGESGLPAAVNVVCVVPASSALEGTKNPKWSERYVPDGIRVRDDLIERRTVVGAAEPGEHGPDVVVPVGAAPRLHPAHEQHVRRMRPQRRGPVADREPLGAARCVPLPRREPERREELHVAAYRTVVATRAARAQRRRGTAARRRRRRRRAGTRGARASFAASRAARAAPAAAARDRAGSGSGEPGTGWAFVRASPHATPVSAHARKRSPRSYPLASSRAPWQGWAHAHASRGAGDRLGARALGMHRGPPPRGVPDARRRGPPSAWFDSAWGRRVRLFVDNSRQDETLEQLPVLVVLTPERFDYASAAPDGSDLRFVDPSTRAVLPHEVEQWQPGRRLARVGVRAFPARRRGRRDRSLLREPRGGRRAEPRSASSRRATSASSTSRPTSRDATLAAQRRRKPRLDRRRRA